MEINVENKLTKQKSTIPSAIRLDRPIMRQLMKLVERSNRKQFGRKIKTKSFLQNLINLVDDELIDKTIKRSQEESLTHSDRQEISFRRNLSLFAGSKDKYEEKLMELMDNYLISKRS